jgi:hypothetical protein
MNLAQLFLQLGICGAMLFVFWQIASKWIDKNSESEKQKNDAIAEGFRSLTTAVVAVSASVADHHAADIESHGEQNERLASIEGVLEIKRRRSTPAGGTTIERGPRFKTNGGDR